MSFLSERNAEKPSERGSKKLYGALALMSRDTGDQCPCVPALCFLLSWKPSRSFKVITPRKKESLVGWAFQGIRWLCLEEMAVHSKVAKLP